MCAQGVGLTVGSFFFMLWPDIISRVGRVTSDLVLGKSVMQGVRVNHIASVSVASPDAMALISSRAFSAVSKLFDALYLGMCRYYKKVKGYVQIH